MRVKVSTPQLNEKGQALLEKFQKCFSAEGLPLDKNSGFTEEKNKDLGFSFEPAYSDIKEVENGRLHLKKKHYSDISYEVVFDSYSHVEISGGDINLILLDGSCHQITKKVLKKIEKGNPKTKESRKKK